jgi:hypothetical protein
MSNFCARTSSTLSTAKAPIGEPGALRYDRDAENARQRPSRCGSRMPPRKERAMLDRIAGNGARYIIVESPDRFARDLTVQLTGHDFLKKLGVALIPATAPDFFMQNMLISPGPF